MKSIRFLINRLIPDRFKSDFVGPFFRIRSSPLTATLTDDPTQVRKVRVLVEGNIKSKQIYVNGKAISLEPEQKKGSFHCEASTFEVWENIIAFSIEDKVKNVILKVLSETDVPSISSTGNGPKRESRHKIDIDGNSSFLKNGSTDRSIYLAWEFIQNSLNQCEQSSFKGTYYGCFDETHNTYRLSSWLWCDAVVVKAMLVHADKVLDDEWILKAQILGSELIKRWTSSQNDVGGMLVRWDVSMTSPIGIVPWRSPNDVAFIAANCMLPLYEKTGNSDYINVALDMGHWILEKGLLPDGRMRVGYRDDLRVWDDSWLYVDAGSAGAFFSRMYNITSDETWRNALVCFIDWYITSFVTKDGFFRWTWSQNMLRRGRNVFSRGQAWALDGLIAAYQATGERHYITIAENCADVLLRAQSYDGSWPYILERPSSGPCNKGTPIIAYQFLSLFQYTHDFRLKASAIRALEWCAENQRRDLDNPYTCGGIFALNDEGAITGSGRTSTSFVYSVAYYIIAKYLAEELS